MSQQKFAISKPHKSKKQRGGGPVEIPAKITYRPVHGAYNPYLDKLNKISQHTEIIFEDVVENFDLPDGVEADLLKARQIMLQPVTVEEGKMYHIYVKMITLSYMLHALEEETDKYKVYLSLLRLGDFKLIANKTEMLFFISGMMLRCVLTRIFTVADLIKSYDIERTAVLRNISDNREFIWSDETYYKSFVTSCKSNPIVTTLEQYNDDKMVQAVLVIENKFVIYPKTLSMGELSPEENDKYVAVVKISYVLWLLGDGKDIEDWVVLILLKSVATLQVFNNDKVVLTVRNTAVNPCVFDHIVGKFATYLIHQLLYDEQNMIINQVKHTRTIEWPENLTYKPFSPFIFSCLFNLEQVQPILDRLTSPAIMGDKNTEDKEYMQAYIIKISNVLGWLKDQKNSRVVYDLLKCVASIYVDPTTQKLVVKDNFYLFAPEVWKEILAKHTKNIMGLLKKEVKQQAAQKKDLLARVLAQKSFEWPRQMSYHHPVLIDCSKKSYFYNTLNEQCIVSLEDGVIKPDFLFLAGALGEIFISTIKTSYLLWLLQAVEDSRAVYELLKLQFFITLDPNNPQKLKVENNNHANEECLFKDIIAKHEKNIVGIIKKNVVRQEREKEDILEAVRTKQAFVWPSVIPSKPFHCDGSQGSFYFKVLLNDLKYQFVLENDVIKPDLSVLVGANYNYDLFKFAIKISYISWLLQGETDSQVVYTLLKYVVAMSVDPSTNELILRGYFSECLSPLLDSHKENIKKLLLQKKQARMTLLTQVPGIPGAQSEMTMDSLYVCGSGKDDCAPIKNSDVLLSFLKKEGYVSWAFSEVVFKTMQAMYPDACFLHDINIEWYNANDNSYVRNNEFYNDTPVTSKYFIYTHLGRNNESMNTVLSFEQYKRDQIDTCLARVGNVGGLKPLIAIPVGIPGHANMLIIDLNKKEVEHFEPHGERFNDSLRTSMQQHIETDFRHISAQLFPTCTYIPRSNATNFQSVLNQKFKNSIYGGTCAVWSIWYAYLRLSHPEFSREVILKQSRALLEKNDFSELERFIIKFMQQLNSLVGMYQVGDKFYAANGRASK